MYTVNTSVNTCICPEMYKNNLTFQICELNRIMGVNKTSNASKFRCFLKLSLSIMKWLSVFPVSKGIATRVKNVV